MAINQYLKNAVNQIKFLEGLKQAEIAAKLGVSNTYLSDMINGRVPFTDSISDKIYELFHINTTAKNEASELNKPEETKSQTNLIPFYDDATSIGGINERAADMQEISQPTDYIDAGDWFKDATSAIRHYGESMTEYPSGCILALKEVVDRRLIIPGRDYVIGTSEYRVTKRIQLIKDGIRAHSTNDEKYQDGSLIHQSFDIPFELINKIFLILGYVVKKNGGTMAYNTQKK